jgi:hypothetical protein
LRQCSVCIFESRYREVCAAVCVYGNHDVVDEVNDFAAFAFRVSFSQLEVVACVCPRGGNVDFHKRSSTAVNCREVFINNFLSFRDKLLVNRIFHVLDCFICRNDFSKSEERRLQNRADESAQTNVFCDLNTVNRVQLDVVFSNVRLDSVGEVFF